MFSKTENDVEIFSRHHPMSARRAANSRRLTPLAGATPVPFDITHKGGQHSSTNHTIIDSDHPSTLKPKITVQLLSLTMTILGDHPCLSQQVFPGRQRQLLGFFPKPIYGNHICRPNYNSKSSECCPLKGSLFSV